MIQSQCENLDIDVAFINITATQLSKSIIDATVPVRDLLKNNGIHDYSSQEQGNHAKVTLEIFYLEDYFEHEIPASKVTLYKPNSKRGDPRIWFTNLKKHVEAGDVLAVIPNETHDGLYAFNVADQEGFNAFISDKSAWLANKVGV